VLRIEGLEPNSYARQQQDKAILSFDEANTTLYLRDLLCIDPGHGRDGWTLECLLPNGERRTVTIPKHKGYSPCPPDRQMTLLQLDTAIGYIRLPHFAPSDRTGDEKRLSTFFAGGSRWQRIIIDIRENQGGDPTLWVNSILAPLIRTNLTWTQDSLVHRTWVEQHANLYPISPAGYVELRPKGRAELLEGRPLPISGDWRVYRVARSVSPLRGGLLGMTRPTKFNGKVYLLIDDRSFSAADDFAAMAQLTSFATLVGTPTMGGTANLAKPTPVCLPPSKVILWLELEATLSSDGRIRELTGTKPDIHLPPARIPAKVTREAILQDPWVRWIMSRSI
jgi:hypothetical protein